MKKDNIGKECILEAVQVIIGCWHGGFPSREDFLLFTIVNIYKGGYWIRDSRGNTYKVKSKDIILI